MKKVLIINLGWEQEPIIRNLTKRPEIELYGIHNGSYNDEEKKFNKILFCQYNELEKIIQFAKERKITNVITDQCDYSLFTQAILAHHLNLKGPSLKAAYMSNNKYLQRELSNAEAITIPKFQLCYAKEDIIKFARINNYPVVIKPVDNRGSIGVSIVRKEEEAMEALLKAVSNSTSNLVLVEEFIDGKQFTVDGYIHPENGCQTLAIGEKIMLGEQSPVAMGISYPSKIENEQYTNLRAINEKNNNKLGYNWGLTHTEYMERDGKFYMIESANRGGGCLTSQIVVPHVSGINLPEIYINDCLNIPYDRDILSEPLERETTLRFFSFKSGKIKSIQNWEYIKSQKEVLYGRINMNIGGRVEEITNDANRHGFIIIKGNLELSDKLISILKPIYD